MRFCARSAFRRDSLLHSHTAAIRPRTPEQSGTGITNLHSSSDRISRFERTPYSSWWLRAAPVLLRRTYFPQKSIKAGLDARPFDYEIWLRGQSRSFGMN